MRYGDIHETLVKVQLPGPINRSNDFVLRSRGNNRPEGYFLPRVIRQLLMQSPDIHITC